MPPKQVQNPQEPEEDSDDEASDYRVSIIRPKKFYTDMVGVVTPLATFAGGLTLATQFIIQCPDSRLQALLALASQLFLASPLGCLLIYVLLYGFDDKENIKGQRRSFVIAQFFIVALFLLTAFVILSVAIMVAGNTGVGINGIILLGLVIVGCVLAGMGIWTTGTLPVEGRTNRRSLREKLKGWRESFVAWWRFTIRHREGCKDVGYWTVRLLLAAFILESWKLSCCWGLAQQLLPMRDSSVGVLVLSLRIRSRLQFL